MACKVSSENGSFARGFDINNTLGP